MQENARPQIKRFLDGPDEYDVVFVGFPSWWETMPMAMFTFLERYDFTNKRIIPFCSNEGSGMGSSERAKLFIRAETEKIGISVMKPFHGGQLLSDNTSPFRKELTKNQCI